VTRENLRCPASGRGSALRFLFRELPAHGRRPAIFLDRDGVINERIVDGYVSAWHEFCFLQDAQIALRETARLRLPVLVVSNQSGVGRGLVARQALREITRRFVESVERHGGRIDGVYYCPHRPDEDCPCRKPKPGLLLQAARDWRIDLLASVMVGDTESDIEAARRAGCRSILLEAQSPAVENDANLDVGATALAQRVAELPILIARLLGRS
jgi:D-glycero-D-manno-heptose 1,7-bisphosphate phosphatase